MRPRPTKSLPVITIQNLEWQKRNPPPPPPPPPLTEGLKQKALWGGTFVIKKLPHWSKTHTLGHLFAKEAKLVYRDVTLHKTSAHVPF